MELHIFQPFLKRGPFGRFRNRFRGRLFPSCGKRIVHAARYRAFSNLFDFSFPICGRSAYLFQQFVQFVIGIGKRKESRFFGQLHFQDFILRRSRYDFLCLDILQLAQRLLAVTVNQPFGNYNKVYAVHLVQLLYSLSDNAAAAFIQKCIIDRKTSFHIGKNPAVCFQKINAF